MAVVLAVGGAGAFIGGLIVYDNLSDSSYSDHSDYSDYSDYDDYDDAEQRRRIRIKALKEDTEYAAKNLSDYKRCTVNPELDSLQLKKETAMKVSIMQMKKDAQNKIQKQMDAQMRSKAGALEQELNEIDKMILKIEEIERENKI